MTKAITLKTRFQASEVDQHVEAFSTNPNKLSLFLNIDMAEGENWHPDAL